MVCSLFFELQVLSVKSLKEKRAAESSDFISYGVR